MNPSKKATLSILILLIVHISGAIGLFTEYADWFVQLTPLNLLLCLVLLLWNHRPWKMSLIPVLIGIGVLGFFVEVIGVTTGWPFGVYHYGTTLGSRVYGVPLIIGINWILLVYAFNSVTSKTTFPLAIRAALAALGMVALDFLIEPVAIWLYYWRWEATEVPWLNYAGWFVVAFLFSLMIQPLLLRHTNKVAIWLLLIMVGFFGFLNFMI